MPRGDQTTISTDERLLFAAETLGVEPEAAFEQARAAFLRRLRQAEFLPPAEVSEAFAILAGREVQGRSVVDGLILARAEKEQSARIDEFAASFFATPVAPRKERWDQLKNACSRHEQLRARLDSLEPGLGVVVGDLSNEPKNVQALANSACEIFVMARRSRTIARQIRVRELLEATDVWRKDWARARKRLRRRHREIAALVPELIDQIAPNGSKRLEIRRKSSTQAECKRSAEPSPSRQPVEPRRRSVGRTPCSSGVTESAGRRRPCTAWWEAVSVTESIRSPTSKTSWGCCP